MWIQYVVVVRESEGREDRPLKVQLNGTDQREGHLNKERSEESANKREENEKGSTPRKMLGGNPVSPNKSGC